MIDELVVQCSGCGFLEVLPADAWAAMGQPAPAELGWHPDDEGGWLCEDNGCCDAA